ncbi:MAG: hypothetical protein ACC657_16655 [Thiohalomonadales bacterium]
MEQYPWSSYPAYINHSAAPSWLERDSIYSELGSVKKYRRYQQFVDCGIDEDTVKFYAKKNTPSVFGDKPFAKRASKQSNNWSKEVTKSGLIEPIKMNRIVQHVAQYFDCTEKSIYCAQRGAGSKNIPRWIAMKLC